MPSEVEEIVEFVKPYLESLAKSLITSISLDGIKQQLDKLKPHKLTSSQQIGKIITEEMINFEESHPDLEGHTFLEWENNVKILSQWIREGCQEDSAVLRELEKTHPYRSNHGNYSAIDESEIKSILNNIRQSVNQVSELRSIKDSFTQEAILAEHKLTNHYLQDIREQLKRAPTNDNTSIKKTLAEVITKERPAAPSSHFIGRKRKIEEIERILCEQSNIAVLYGMGGIGKTEICRKFFYDYSIYLGTNLVKKFGWISYKGSLQNSFFGTIS